jgi:hypothetical protein
VPAVPGIDTTSTIPTKFKKDLVVIGQDCWENDETLVAPFVKKMGIE